MNAHAFRSDDLATACRLDVEREEQKKTKDARRAERRKRAAERQRRFMSWYDYDGSVIVWGAFFLLLFGGGIALGSMITDRNADASNTRDKIACYRVCKSRSKSTILGVSTTKLDVGRVCTCFREDGVKAEVLSEEMFEALRR